MITLLSKLFIKNRDQYSDAKVRHAYGILCSVLGILLNLFIAAAKFFAGALSGSVAITADALNNLSDSGSSVVTLLGFKLAAQKPDREHPFGHGRMEYISGLIVSFFIFLMGYELIKSSVKKIIEPAAVEFSLLSAAILVGSLFVKIYIAIYNRRIGKKIDSAAMIATSADALSDCISTVLVLISMILNRLWGINADGWCGVIVALMIFYAGYTAAKGTISPLLGQKPADDFVRGIERIILSNPHINNIHDLIIHDYGPGRKMISVHAEVSADEDLLSIHDSIDNTEKQLAAELECEVVIHMDPIVKNDPKINDLLERVTNTVRSIDQRFSIHDFRIVSGPTHTNLIFDVVIPIDYPVSDDEIKRNIIDQIISYEDDTYFAVITIDKSYC